MKILRFLLALLVLSGTGLLALAQAPASRLTSRRPALASADNALLWEVSGPGLTQKSYLFGTMHTLTAVYLDSVAGVKQAFTQSRTVVGEMVMDSAVTPLVLRASVLPEGTTLRSLLPPATYAAAAAWLKDLAGADLAQLDRLNPMAVNLTLLTLAFQKQFPQPPGVAMDVYFQQEGRRAGKLVVGLETPTEQINLLYGQFTPARQAELPALLRADATFVAVGAMHLFGPQGLVQLLRRQGYTVRAVRS